MLILPPRRDKGPAHIVTAEQALCPPAAEVWNGASGRPLMAGQKHSQPSYGAQLLFRLPTNAARSASDRTDPQQPARHLYLDGAQLRQTRASEGRPLPPPGSGEPAYVPQWRVTFPQHQPRDHDQTLV